MEKSNACLRGPNLFRQINKKVSPIMMPITEDKKIATKIEFSKYRGSHFKKTYGKKITIIANNLNKL